MKPWNAKKSMAKNRHTCPKEGKSVLKKICAEKDIMPVSLS
jgi:hypothetical protein